MLKTEFDEALRLFNFGDYSKVVKICELRQQHPMFKLLLATAYSKLAHFEQAELLFAQLIQQYPSNLDVLFNYALMLKLQQRNIEALSILRQCLTLNNTYHPAHHALACIYADQGLIASAKSHFEYAITFQPDNADYLYGSADLDYSQTDYKTACEKLYGLLSKCYHGPSIRLLAATLYKLKQVRAMRTLCVEYANFVQNEPDVLMYAGLMELDEKCYVQAQHFLLQAQAKMTESSFDIDANVLYCSYLLDADKQTLQQIVRRSEQENTEQAYHFSTNLLETLGELEDAAGVLEKALESYPQSQNLLLTKAKILTRQNYLAEALALLSGISETIADELQLDLCYQKVQIFEASGDYLQAAQEIIKAGQLNNKTQVIDVLQRDVQQAQQDLSYPRLNAAAHQRQLIFIIGFPRSGTTLLESRLSCFNKVKILEETHAVKQFYLQLQDRAGTQNVMAFLAEQSEEQLLMLAQLYLQSLQQYYVLEDDDIIVDKMPLNAIYLAPILSLFPQAKVILMLRHPMDVCISSLKQRMINLFSVEDFAQSYHCYFTLLMQLEQCFHERVLTVKYEQLVTEYQQVFSSIVEHCGITTEPDLSQFSTIGKVRMFNTPSYHQVSQPLYTKAVNSYLHYEAFFQFQHPLLRRWCKQLKYETV